MISQLGRYEVISELGQGAMGIVYKARDPLIDRIVAIKTINLCLALEEREEYEARFYQEAKAAGRLIHPNIVTIFDVGRTGDIAYIAMEYLQGRELRDILNETPLLPIIQVLDIIIQVAKGLAYAHEHEIVHRDVKPSNVMIVRDGHVKITDFGIARMASAAVRTQTGIVLGSPKYMSPEQVLGKVTDQRSDIFSLGVVLYEMLTGQVPFIGENLKETLNKCLRGRIAALRGARLLAYLFDMSRRLRAVHLALHPARRLIQSFLNAIMYQTLNAIPAPPSNANPAVPEMLNYIVAKSLAKDLEARYQNVSEMVNDLRACRETLPRATDAAQAASRITTITRSTDGDDSKTVVALGLSSSFDSNEATMRLAAMTASKEEVEELSKTLRIERPSMAGINRTTPRNGTPRPVHRGAEAPGNGGGYLLLAIVVLIVLGLLFAFIF